MPQRRSGCAAQAGADAVVLGSGSMACPREGTLAELVEGLLDEAAASAVERHADECTTCRRTLALLVKAAPRLVATEGSAGSDSQSRPPRSPLAQFDALVGIPLAPGDTVAGRYRVERLLA